ncbi:MAG: serine/threonine protein kinase [Caldilineales bacterium]|nr:serine/threonine protein kinase [Caldilineales bacterium]
MPSSQPHFRLDRRLGGGGFADVYLAFDARRGHHVALKVLHPHHANSPEVLRRFQREGEQMLKLRHQHIVGAYEVSQVAGYHTIAMPYLSGGSLADLLAKQKRLNVSVAAAIAGQVAAALDFVHPQVIHRDLKPSNVLLDGQGNCLVADFGVAHVAGESTLTPAGYQPGTPHYMAPEQVRPALGKVSPATDVWALGVILYEMLCGRRRSRPSSQAVMFRWSTTRLTRPLVHRTRWPCPPRWRRSCSSGRWRRGPRSNALSAGGRPEPAM